VTKMKAQMKHIIVVIALTLIGCAAPLDVRSTSTAELERRRTEIDRKLAKDDLGVAWGVTRWVSHASEKNNVLKEKKAIDAELMRRQQTNRKSAGSTSERGSQ
jgi:hypothetical protein